jgi:hypothetical protein
MKEKHDARDESKDKTMEQIKEKIKNDRHIGRMYNLSEPRWLIIFATFFSILMGSLMPVFGIYIGKMLFVL